MKPKNTGPRAFFLSFFLSLALLGGVGAGLLALAQEPVPDRESSAPPYLYQPTKEDALTILLMGGEKDTLPPERYLLVRFSPDKGRLGLFLLPTELEATVNITTGTLPELYDYGGIEAVKQGVENAFFVRVDRYVRYSDEELTAFVDAVGGVEYEVEKAVEYRKNGETFRLTQGYQLLSGSKLLAYRNSPLLTELSGEERLKKEGELFQKCLEQKLGKMTEKELGEWFGALTNVMQTDLSRYDLAARKEAVLSFLRSEEREIVLHLPEGSIREEWDGEKFTPSQRMKQTLQEWCEPSL